MALSRGDPSQGKGKFMGLRSEKAGVRSPTFGFLLTALLTLASAPASSHEVTTFEADVKPILQKSCGGATCHINNVQSGVELSTFPKTMASVGVQYGGPLVVPRDPGQSPFIDKVSGSPPPFCVKMPFFGDA